MHTTDDLTFLKAQEAELEYLVKAAPPGAVIERTQYERELKEVREALLQRVSTETPADLPWLKAQAAELERLIRIAPPSAVIAKYQYEEQLAETQAVIQSLESQNSVTANITGVVDPHVSRLAWIARFDPLLADDVRIMLASGVSETSDDEFFRIVGRVWELWLSGVGGAPDARAFFRAVGHVSKLKRLISGAVDSESQVESTKVSMAKV